MTGHLCGDQNESIFAKWKGPGGRRVGAMPATKVCPVTRSSLTNSAGTGSSGSAETETVSSTSLPSLSPYQRVLRNLNHDERWQKEIALGRRIGFYRFRGDLGSGNFSQVKQAIHCLTKEKVAIKILDKAKLDHKTQRMLTREISSMESLHHPHIIRLYEVIDTLSKIYLIMEFANGGELFQRISRDGKFSEEDAKPLLVQVTAAIDHMHQHNIVHRDIKAENVFFSGPKTVKVGDFGFSTQIANREDTLSTFCGSPPYAAPELFKDESYQGPLVDVWALGILLYFMVTGTMPFKAQTVAALKKMILEGTYTTPAYLSDDCQTLIGNVLKQNPRERYSIQQLKNCDWLKGQVFPSGLPKYNVHPSLDSALNDEEREAREYLLELGLSEDLIRDCEDKGSRSNVTGTYRIVLHRLQVATAVLKDPSNPGDDDDQDDECLESLSVKSTPKSANGKLSRVQKKFSFASCHNGRRSRTCVLL